MFKLEKALAKARAQREQLELSPEIIVDDGIRSKSDIVPTLVRGQPSDLRPAGGVAESRGEALTKQVTVRRSVLNRNRIVADSKSNSDSDIFRMLRTKVLRKMTQGNLRTLAVTSPNYGDGKTTIALNLAVSLALDVKQTVLLVDMDFRHPSVHTRLGLKPSVGLSDYILQDAPVSECLVNPMIDRLVILPIAQPFQSSSELLGTPKMVSLAHELKTRYADRIVIYDLPPLLAQDDTIAFLPNVDGVLLVVRDGDTRPEDIKHSLRLLEDTNLLGTVLNRCPEQSFNERSLKKSKARFRSLGKRRR